MKLRARLDRRTFGSFLAAALPLLFSSTAARAEDAPPKPLDALVKTLSSIESPEVQANILRGMNAALKGRRSPPVPQGWQELYEKLKASPNESVRQQAQALAATFGGGGALDELRKVLADSSAKIESRQSALDSLLSTRDAKSLPLLLDLVKQPGPLRAAALRGLANFDDAKIPAALLDAYNTLDSAEKRDALNSLLGRPESAHALLAAIDAKTLDRAVITAPIARQLQNLHDTGIDAWMTKNWGAMRTSPEDKQKEIARLKKSLDPYSILHADASRGRAIFTQTCAICHTLFGYGAKIGPELPGSFEDVDYLLLNIVDPNAIIGKDYQQTFIQTKDGRTLSGIIASDDNTSITLKTLAGPVTVQHADVKSTEVSPNSLMPEGLLSALDERSVRDLFLYLRQKSQVPLLVTQANAGDFFNGNDLSKWRTSSDDAWKVVNGEIIGHGGAQKAAWLRSEMIAGDYKLSANVNISGTNPIVELTYYGRPDMTPFVGESLSMGGRSKLNLWGYRLDKKPVAEGEFATVIKPGTWTTIQIVSTDREISISISEPPARFEGSFLSKLSPDRNGFAFYVQGPDSELRIKDLKLETSEK